MHLSTICCVALSYTFNSVFSTSQRVNVLVLYVNECGNVPACFLESL